MTDREFIQAFEDTTLEPFHHRDHLRVTWLYVQQYGEDGTRPRLAQAILRYAAARNVAEKYHETITQTWIYLVAAAKSPSFDAMLESYPHFLDKKFLDRFYSPALLQSPEARRQWVEPDLAKLNVSL